MHHTSLFTTFLTFAASTLLAQEPVKLAVPVGKRDAAGTVTLTAATPGAVIRYSIDGSDPGPKGGRYLAEIWLEQPNAAGLNVNDALVAAGHARFQDY